MKTTQLLPFFALFFLPAWMMAQPENDECVNAFHIDTPVNWCSSEGQFTTFEATADTNFDPSCLEPSDDVWFSFTTVAPSLSISVLGGFFSNQLSQPQIGLYSGACGQLNEVGCQTGNGLSLQAIETGLELGQTYYLEVQGLIPGSFVLCINNYSGDIAAVSDCPDAVVLCNQDPFVIPQVLNAGNDPNEANDAPCLNIAGLPVESFSTWFVWTAAEDGDLTFSLNPINATDDLDFVLYEFPNGPGDCSGKIVRRCMASSCPGATGLNDTALDNAEPPGCGPGQDNFLSALQMEEGRTYGLMVNNFSQTTIGFEVEFGGTSSFFGGENRLAAEADQVCQDSLLSFTGLNPPGSATVIDWQWEFGVGATPSVASGPGPHEVAFSNSGTQYVLLRAITEQGCTSSEILPVEVVCCADNFIVTPTVTAPSCPGNADGAVSLDILSPHGPPFFITWEDALIFNGGAIDRGLFRTTYLNMYETFEETANIGGSMVNTRFGNIQDKNVLGTKAGYDYGYLDSQGLIKENTYMNDKIIVIGKMSMSTGSTGTFTDASVKPKKGQKGYIDKAYITDGEEGKRIAKVRIREERMPAIGDKFCSRAGQKGTVGIVLPEKDMPFTADGIKPDLIVNPHALPSRMTIGQLVECLMGKAVTAYGGYGDCTGFVNKGPKHKIFGEMLSQQGFHSSGTEVLYNGMTGEQLESDIFIGPTYYLRLKHMVKDKINYRARGPRTNLTRQTVHGRANDGGLRVGEMERDGIISHGASKMLQESMLDRGDDYYMAVCNKTGLVAIYNENRDIYLSPYVDGPIQFSDGLNGSKTAIETRSKHGRDFSIVRVPYCYKLLKQELETMGVQMRIITDDNIDQVMSMMPNDEETKQLTGFKNYAEIKEYMESTKLGIDVNKNDNEDDKDLNQSFDNTIGDANDENDENLNPEPEQVGDMKRLRPTDKLVGDKRDFFFFNIPYEQRVLLKMDDVANYSVTEQKSAGEIAKIIEKYVGKNAHVVDATSAVGGNTITFAKTFDSVTAIELNMTRFEYLKHNMEVLGLSDKINFLQGSSVDLIPNVVGESDAIFYDPPWGGTNYKETDKLRLELGGKPFVEVCNEASNYTKYIVCKLPVNFDLDDFMSKSVCSLEEKITSLRKMLVIVLRCPEKKKVITAEPSSVLLSTQIQSQTQQQGDEDETMENTVIRKGTIDKVGEISGDSRLSTQFQDSEAKKFDELEKEMTKREEEEKMLNDLATSDIIDEPVMSSIEKPVSSQVPSSQASTPASTSTSTNDGDKKIVKFNSKVF